MEKKTIISAVIIILILVAALVFILLKHNSATSERCGNGNCGRSENCSSCPQDCGSCAAPPKPGKCGDGLCEPLEKANPSLCPEDCKQTHTTTPPKNTTRPGTTTQPENATKPGNITQPSTTQPGNTAQSGNNTQPPAISEEDSPFGMHPADIKNSYAEALDMGVKWDRPSTYMFWFIVQPNTNSDDYNFTFYDAYYGSVPTGLHILANIAPDNPKSAHGKLLPNSYLPVDKEKYLKFVKAAVERYDGDGIDDMPGLKNPILYWQVGNEPNDRGQLKDFAELQRITYGAIKEACSNCKVLIGGAAQPMVIRGNGEFITNSGQYLSDFSTSYEPYLKELNGYGFDIFDFHWYGNATGDYAKIGPVYKGLKSKLEAYGFGNADVWVNEMGSYSGTPAASPFYKYQTEKQQAADYLKRFVFPISLGIKKVFPAFGLIEGFKGNDGYFDHTGFIYDGTGSDDLGKGIKKLSYYTYKLMVEKLDGSDWKNIQTIQESDGISVYKFTKNGKGIWVAWNDNAQEQQITISAIASNQVKITEAVPKYATGKEVIGYATAFNTEVKTVSNGQVALQLGQSPVYIEQA